MKTQGCEDTLRHYPIETCLKITNANPCDPAIQHLRIHLTDLLTHMLQEIHTRYFTVAPRLETMPVTTNKELLNKTGDIRVWLFIKNKQQAPTAAAELVFTCGSRKSPRDTLSKKETSGTMLPFV